MLFHSAVFLCLYLPATLAAYYGLAPWQRARAWVLVFASLLFYGYWDLRAVPLLLASILVNWLVAVVFTRRPRAWLIPLGVAANLTLLGVFKYADLFADTVAGAGGWEREPWNLVLPLAISFFTFQQISYLADLARGKAPLYSLRDYALFIAFFPQLDCRADRPASRDHQPVRPRPAPPGLARAMLTGPRALRHGPDQESHTGR